MMRPRRSRRRRHYAKAPPMATAGGLVIAGIGAVVGYQATDVLDRYVATYSTTASPAPALPAGFTGTLAQYNAQVVAAKPGIWRVVSGLGMMVLGFGGGAIAPWAGLKMFMYGWGLGATAHLGGQLLNGYVLEPMFMTNGVPSATGARLYSAENAANTVIHPAAATTTASTTTSTTQGLGAPPTGLYSQRGTPIAALAAPRHTVQQARIPAALASRRGGRLGDVTLDLSSSPLETARQNPPITPPPAPPITPPAPPSQYSPPVVPPPAPPAYTPPATYCAPCAPQPGPPQGGTPSCGCASAGSCGQCGAPPEEVANYRHPLFRTLTQHHSNVRSLRRAA
jgi:hypothetical protein